MKVSIPGAKPDRCFKKLLVSGFGASFLLGGSSQIRKWWSFPMAGFLSPRRGCGVSLKNSWLAIGPGGLSQEALTLLKSMFRSNALQPSITTLNEALTACERGVVYCGGKIFLFSGEFSLERRVAEASWAGGFFLGGEGIEQERLPCLVGCAEIWEGYRPKTIASLPCEFLELVLLDEIFCLTPCECKSCRYSLRVFFFRCYPRNSARQYHQFTGLLEMGNARVSLGISLLIS